MSLSQAGTGANPGIFSRLVRTAVAAGVVAGLLLTGVQHLQVTTIIGQAEVFESAAESAPAPASASSQNAAPAAAPEVHAHADGAQHVHGQAAAPASSSAEPAHADGHDGAHEHGGWEPEDGVERTLYTALADVSMAVGYGLLLAAVIALRGDAVNWRSGVLWGAAGYLVFFVAPSLGLPPELPGTAAAPVAARQGWWLCTALSTAIALGVLAFSRNWALKLAAVALVAVPHLIGAPQPLVHSSVAPAELASAFIVATALANAVFWLALGGLTGFFYKRFA